MSGGTKVEAPPVDPNVSRLNAMNIKLLEQSAAQNEQLKPFQYQAMGIKETAPAGLPPALEAERAELQRQVAAYDAIPDPQERRALEASNTPKVLRLQELGRLASAPGIAKLTEEEYYASLSPTERQSYDLQKLAYERTKQAYEGKLPISPAMEKALAEQKTVTEEGLRRRLGSNWGLSTSGIQSMGDFNTNAELMREEARRGQITSGEGILLARQGFGQGLTQQNYQNYVGYPQSTLGLSSGLVNATQPYLNYAQMQNAANIANAQNKQAERTALMTGLGQIGGLALGGYLGGAFSGPKVAGGGPAGVSYPATGSYSLLWPRS